MKILRSIRNNIFIVLFAALFSGMLIVSKHFVLRMDGAFSGHLKDVSIFHFHWFDVVAWLALTTLFSAFLIAVVSVLSKGLARGAPARRVIMPELPPTPHRMRFPAAIAIRAGIKPAAQPFSLLFSPSCSSPGCPMRSPLSPSASSRTPIPSSGRRPETKS